MNQTEQPFGGIDQAIGQIEKLYRAVTGKDAPAVEGAYAPIPAEKDPSQHVEEQLNACSTCWCRSGRARAKRPAGVRPCPSGRASTRSWCAWIFQD